MPDCVMLEMHPAYRRVRDENRWQQAAEQVAYAHFRRCSPEFVQYVTESVGESIPFNTVAAVISALTREAHLVQQAKGIADCVRDDFVTFVANAESHSSWKLVRDLYEEVRKEAQC
jgi:hypothetical protein